MCIKCCWLTQGSHPHTRQPHAAHFYSPCSGDCQAASLCWSKHPECIFATCLLMPMHLPFPYNVTLKLSCRWMQCWLATVVLPDDTWTSTTSANASFMWRSCKMYFVSLRPKMLIIRFFVQACLGINHQRQQCCASTDGVVCLQHVHTCWSIRCHHAVSQPVCEMLSL